MTHLQSEEGNRQTTIRHHRSQSMQDMRVDEDAHAKVWQAMEDKETDADAKSTTKEKYWARNECFSPIPSTSFSHILPKPSGHGAAGKAGQIVTSPLMFYSEDAIHEVCRGSNRCRPRGPFSGLFSSFLTCLMPKDSIENKAWAKSRSSALLELSKRQQSALADKQDAIDLLEWKLEQLQATNTKKAASSQQPKAPEVKSSTLPANALCDTSSETSRSGSSLSSHGSSESSGDSLSTCSATHDLTLADLCRDAKESFSEDSWKAAETARPSKSQEMMTMGEKVLLFEMAVIRARGAVRYFCKVFMKQMESSGYSLWRTLAAIDPSAKFSKKEHTAYALEANINKALYHCFENDSFDDTGLTLIIDPGKRCAARFEEFQRLKLVDSVDAANSAHTDFEPKFLAFCEQKMREMWFLFPWNIVFKDSDERKHFTGAFLDAAKCIWLLHRLASSLYPAATILRMGKGMEINPQYVETLAGCDTICAKCKKNKVQFMTMPGFQVHQKVIKCQVYQHLQCDQY